MSTIRTCGCENATAERTNPTTGGKLLLCERHAAIHDDGHGGIVVHEMPRSQAEKDFVEASVAVWRQIDACEAGSDGYLGLDAGCELRIVERAAWERYRDELDGVIPQCYPEEEK